jgi:hypothetical protein
MSNPLLSGKSSQEAATKSGEPTSLTREQLAFAEVVGREIAKRWREEQRQDLNVCRVERLTPHSNPRERACDLKSAVGEISP